MIANDNNLKKDPNYIFALERNIKKIMFLLVITLSILLALAIIAIIILVPLKEKQPYLVFFSTPDNNFVRVEKANYNIKADNLLLRSIIAGYVIKRETINRIDDDIRYKEIATQSSNQVWKTFQTLVTQKNSIYSTNGLYREIQIINSAILSNKVATIDFVAINTQGVNKTYQRYRATISYEFKNQEINYESMPKNPTGFIVNEYQLTKISIENEPQTTTTKAN